MSPENPGFLGLKSQAGRDFYKNPFAFAQCSRHPIGRILTADFTQRRKPCSPPGNWSLPLGGDQHPSVSDDRARPPTPRFRRDGDIPGTVFRAAMRLPVDRDAGASTTLACGGSCSAKSASSRHAPPATGAAFEILNQSIEKPPWPPGQARYCCACSSSRHPTQPTTLAQRRGRAWPAEARKNNPGQSCPRRRAAGPRFADNPVRAHQNRPVSGPCPPSWSSRKFLASRPGLPIHCCDGGRSGVKRGKAPAGQKASRALRRQKRTWRSKK